MFHQWQIESFGNTRVRDIIMRRTYSTRRDDEVVVLGHSTRGFDDFALVVGDDFDAAEVDAEGEAVFGEPGGGGVDGLLNIVLSQRCFQRLPMAWMIDILLTLPPRTSSPIISHAAVLIIRLFPSVAAMIRDVMDGCRPTAAAELCR